LERDADPSSVGALHSCHGLSLHVILWQGCSRLPPNRGCASAHRSAGQPLALYLTSYDVHHILAAEMRRSAPSRKEATHERIVEAAARAIRRSGYGGTGVADIMKEAGLTHGGF